MNAVLCRLCHDIIQSHYNHDFKYCSCQSVFVDGGDMNPRMGAAKGEYLYRIRQQEVLDQLMNMSKEERKQWDEHNLPRESEFGSVY